MDTSEGYIKMCDCPEIQRKWKRLMGDWIWDSHWHQAEVLRYDATKKITDDWREDYIYLPRQDQIQEMLGCQDIQVAHHRLLQLFDFWIGRDLKSLEQLWLAFYMYDRHQKIWDGKKWAS